MSERQESRLFIYTILLALGLAYVLVSQIDLAAEVEAEALAKDPYETIEALKQLHAPCDFLIIKAGFHEEGRCVSADLRRE